MDIVILTFLLYGSVSSFHTVLYEYHFINIALPWTQAQQHCRQHYTDLATFWSLEDVYRVKRPSSYGGVAWIGLFDDPVSWKRIMGNDSNSWKWSATGTTNPGGYQNWASGQPDYYGGKEHCVLIQKGLWYDIPCSSIHPVACFTGSVAPGQKNYTLVTTAMTWEDAQSYCREHYTDMAMIKDVTENSAVSSLYPGGGVWIGLYREPWRWSDGSQKNFTNWYSSGPDSGTQPCTREQSTYLWNDIPCSYSHPFICHRAIRTRESQIEMKFLSGVNLLEPEIYNQIKEQIGAELQRKGLTDFRLKWKIPPH